MKQADFLEKVLTDAKIKVRVTDGWESRGLGDFADIDGIVVHHTGPGSEKGLEDLIRDGRKDLKGPLSQVFLTKDGTWVLIAAGRSNHAGKGHWHGITAGNSHLLGIECHNAGDGGDPWPSQQMESLIKGCAAICKHLGIDEIFIAGHKEWALPKGRKVDPTFDMFSFRDSVAQVLDGQTSPIMELRTVAPSRHMLRKGDQGDSVRELQKLLKKLKLYDAPVDGSFGPKTHTAVLLFQKKHKLMMDGLVGPKTWAKLGV